MSQFQGLDYLVDLMDKNAFMVLPAALAGGALYGALGTGIGTAANHPVNKYISYAGTEYPAFNKIRWGRTLGLGTGLGGLLAGGTLLASGISPTAEV